MNNADLIKHIGKSLQKARKAGGFKSAKAFAEHIKMKPGTYIEYEQGRHPFGIDKAWIFAEALEISIDELCGYPTGLVEYSDKRQEELNGHYKSLNDNAKSDLVGFVKSFAADPARRIVKEGQEALPDKPSMDRTA